MKKNLLTAIAMVATSLLFSLPVSAQGVNFISPNKSWHMLGFSPYWIANFIDNKVADEEFDYTFSEKCDTVIRGVEYKCLMKGGKGDMVLTGIFREEAGRVYRYEPMDGKEYMYYDFTLQEGETFMLDSYWKGDRFKCKVTAVDEVVLANGEKAKRICFEATPTYQEGLVSSQNVWIEGVGHIQAPDITAIDNNLCGGWRFQMPYVTVEDKVPLYTEKLVSSSVHGLPCIINEESAIPDINESNLHCEFVNHALHIWGDVWSANSPNQYIYCIVNEEKEMKLVLEELGPIEEGMGSHKIDLTFEGFSTGTYSIIDATGKHYISMGTDGNGTDAIHGITPLKAPTVYDLHGRRLAGNPSSHGLYIKANKKYLTR